MENNHERKNELFETSLDLRMKLQIVARKEHDIISEPTGKNSNLKQIIPKENFYNLPDDKAITKSWTGRVVLKKDVN